MLKDEAAASTFMALGVCPEDVLVKVPVAQLIVEASSGGAAAAASDAAKTAAMRRSLKALVDRNLLQGSIANGVQMHDIVRDLVRSRLGGDDGICLKQRAVVAAFVSACPAADGWTPDDAVGQYVEQALELHMIEALLLDPLDDADAHSWLLHGNELIVKTAATAMGTATLEALAAAKEGAGDLVGAARVAWAARSERELTAANGTDLAYRTAALLETADDPSCAEFELAVLTMTWLVDMGSERHAKCSDRRMVLVQASGIKTFGSKWSEFFGVWMQALMAWGPWALSQLADIRAATSKMRKTLITQGVEASSLSDVPHERHAAAVLYAHNLVMTSRTCDMDDWNPALCGGEATLVEAMEHWTKTDRKCGLEMKNGPIALNLYAFGHGHVILAMYFGRVPALVQFAEDATAHYRDVCRTREYLGCCIEILHSRTCLTVLVHLGRPAEAYAVLEAMGFGWSDEGFALFDLWFVALSASVPGWTKDGQTSHHRLLLYSASPQSAALDAEVGAWIPAPEVIAQHERDQPMTCCCFMGMLGLAASAFLRLGRDDDAAEAARILVSPEHGCVLPDDLVHGHRVLGQVAAKRGDVEAAGGHFGRALEAAAASRLPLWEVIVARGWKRAVPESGVAADAVIDAACVKMGKSRSQLACDGV
jgi:hypothetical protein